MMLHLQAQPAVYCERLNGLDGMGIGVATLNAEKSLNALSIDMVDLLTAQLQAWDVDPDIAMVVLQGAGDKAFCAGGDLQNLYDSMKTHHASLQHEDLLANAYALNFFTREYRLDYFIHTYRKPILCWGHGIVMGGGMGLMAGASHRVVTEKSRLAMPESAIGLFPDVGGTWFLNRMPGKLGLFLALTGASINASDAQFVKLADYQLPHAHKPALFAILQAVRWSHDATENHQRLHQLLQHQQRAQWPANDVAEGPLRQHFDLINHLCHSHDLPLMVKTLQHYSTENSWLQKAIINLQKACPASLWLAHAIQQRAKHLSLAGVFRLELVVALACARDRNFAEGIRALIIDKDQRPQWSPQDFSEISDVLMQEWSLSFFSSPWTAAQHPLSELGTALVQ
ncbi:MAG: enoyl-CoA hydratase/isomerase family protein [Undibacterium sp.]|nr:enoyl-CoA hydratase/isomerase family protein [Undibacterium sp.]